MEMLAGIREDIRAIKERSGQKDVKTQIPVLVSTVEAPNLLDKFLKSLEERLKLVNGFSEVGGVYLKAKVKRDMEK
ncbi:hypothetical protein SRHO_G00276170 [Serrasalmus rhombeus]